MKVLVAYFSQTGNTKKIAEAIYGEIKQDKEIKKLKEVEGLDGYDFSFIGLPLQAFGPAKDAKDFLKTKTAGKKVALFITHAVPEGAPQLAEWLGKCEKAAAGAEIAGMFDCQGELSQAVADMLLKSDDPNMQAFGKMRSATTGQPDASRIEKAKAFAREMTAILK
jgi:flavodoxin